MNVIFLDTETTDLIGPQLVQLAYKVADTGEEVDEFFHPPVPISFGAMATHHITNRMVADKPVFVGSAYADKLFQIVQGNIVVAHNAEFDIATLANEGIGVVRSIDTEQVARHVLESERYALQYLRYSLDLNVEGQAHDAWGDVLVLEALFYHLVSVVKTRYELSGDEAILEKMMELSATPVLLGTLMFGKYKGKTFVELVEADKQYLEWLYAKKTEAEIDPRDEDLIHTLKYHLQIS